MKSSYNLSVSLNCPSCGETSFDNINDNFIYNNCKRTYTREQLHNANKTKIDVGMEKLKKEAFSDVNKDIQKMLKKSFGSNFKIK
jgi:Zn-finger domain-containing protein